MIRKELVDELGALLGSENVLTLPEDLLCYSFDATMNVSPAIPQAVVLPETAEQVCEVLKLCQREKNPLFPRGELI